MDSNTVKLATVLAGALSLTTGAHGGSTLFYSNTSYLSTADSPWASSGSLGSNFFVESFEDGLLNTVGLTANHGHVRDPGSKTDSVDGDGSGQIDGKGKDGHSYASGGSKSITFSFDSSAIGSMVTMAGLVFTDGKPGCRVTFKAWDADGNLIGKIKKFLGDSSRKGTTAEDRFFGIANTEGISKIKISSNYAGFEVDHVQFGYGFSAVPVPAPIALGAAGLLGLALRGGRNRWSREA